MKNDLNGRSLPLIICIIACLLVIFWGVAGHDLWTPDEPRVAAITLEMVNTGEVIIPHLGGEPFIEKPPLHFVISAFILRFFGPIIGNTAALRLTSALFGLGVLIFTFLIAKRIGGIRAGIASALILCTMIGFIQNYHWIRVDTSLSFFIIASLWCFIEAYYENRSWMLLTAGVFAGCALLSKGLIGPVLIFIPWAGLFIYWLFEFNKNKFKVRPWLGFHFLSLFAFLIISGFWIVQLYFKGGEQLWHEWFWVNHFGRFTGTAIAKGHLKEGEPFYYIIQLIINSMPWTPLFLFWLTIESIEALKKRIVKRETFFLFIWGAGSILLLSIPTTKRGIYLTPVLPSFAIMAGLGLNAIKLKLLYLKWFKQYANFWLFLCVVLLFCIAALPLLISFFPDGKIPHKTMYFLTHLGYLNAISIGSLFILAALLLTLRKQFSGFPRMVLATAMFYISFFGVPVKAIDTVKSMKVDIQQFILSIPKAKHENIAGINFSETMTGSIYYYCGWKVPRIDDPERIHSIVQGNDKEYDTLLVNQRKVKNKETDLLKIEYHIINYTITGRNRGLYLIKGENDNE
ncbi:MAG: glycosyltransferase family 39 protein [Desulfobacteraceae bacterium]|nr:glycosyltransferase family 39 protein [Desulfobacteraceae bacterium]